MTRHVSSLPHESALPDSLDYLHLASLITNGELPFPLDLPPEQQQRLAILVQAARRKHFMEFIARQIARHLHDQQSVKS